MFAIFEKIYGLDWNSFSANYRNSPYFWINLNNQILDKCYESFPICESEDPESVCKKHYQKVVCKKIKSIYMQGMAQTNKFFDISCNRRRNFGWAKRRFKSCSGRSESTSPTWSWIDQRIFFACNIFTEERNLLRFFPKVYNKKVSFNQKSWNWTREETNCNYLEYQRHTKKKQPGIDEESANNLKTEPYMIQIFKPFSISQDQMNKNNLKKFIFT